ncbi:hypothetical protein [Flagellimonas lutaonensis]|nr:hypothetical protein [Allomuricauda lutaonensis]
MKRKIYMVDNEACFVGAVFTEDLPFDWKEKPKSKNSFKNDMVFVPSLNQDAVDENNF